MIAACPKCGARYRIERGKLRRDGTRLRCSRCEAVFRVSPPPAEPEPAEAIAIAEVAPEPVARERAGAASRRRRRSASGWCWSPTPRSRRARRSPAALVDGGPAAGAGARRRRGDPHDPAHAAAGRGARRRAAEDVRLPGLRADEAQREPAPHPGGADRRDPPSRSLPARAQRDLRRRRLPRAPSRCCDDLLDDAARLRPAGRPGRAPGWRRAGAGSDAAAAAGPDPPRARRRRRRRRPERAAGGGPARPAASAGEARAQRAAGERSPLRPRRPRPPRARLRIPRWPRRSPARSAWRASSCRTSSSTTRRSSNAAIRAGNVSAELRSRAGRRAAATSRSGSTRACARCATSWARSCCAWRARGACDDLAISTRASAPASSATSRARTPSCAGSPSSAPAPFRRTRRSALLVERLGDASWRVRKAAVERLVTCPDSADAARRADRGPSATARTRAAATRPSRRWCACGARVVPDLVAAMTDRDGDVRKLVVDALAGIGDARAARRADRAARAMPTPTCAPPPPTRSARSAARRSLRRCARWPTARRRGPAGALLRAARARRARGAAASRATWRRCSRIRCCGPAGIDAARARRTIPRPLDVLLKGLATDSRATREAAMRGAAARSLSRLDGARAERLVAEVREAAAAAPSRAGRSPSSASPRRRSRRGWCWCSSSACCWSERAAVPILLAGRDEALDAGRARHARAARRARRARDRRGAGTVSTAARARDACALFGRLRGERSAARLMAALDESDPELRAAAVRAIGARRLASALPLLVRRLEAVAAEGEPEGEEELRRADRGAHRSSRARAAAMPASPSRPCELLASRLDGADEDVRLAIARVLGRIGAARGHRSWSTLLLKDPSPRVRRAAVDALARLDPETRAPSRSGWRWRTNRRRCGSRRPTRSARPLRPGVIDDLRRLAEDEDARVRAAAIRAIGLHAERRRRRHPRARRAAPGSSRALRRRAAGRARRGRGAAARRRRAGGASVAPLLGAARARDRARGGALRRRARATRPSSSRCSPLVSHPDWSVRAEAIEVLAERRRAPGGADDPAPARGRAGRVRARRDRCARWNGSRAEAGMGATGRQARARR